MTEPSNELSEGRLVVRALPKRKVALLAALVLAHVTFLLYRHGWTVGEQRTPPYRLTALG
ncbi:MAG TPA: hypothetical protein VFF73_10730 [Planctomycetota bacterium]|nr:hypothetical protein [Planctomycetota bacterium]